jgi:hypothetical protein
MHVAFFAIHSDVRLGPEMASRPGEIEPDQIRDYKVDLHKRFLSRWMEDSETRELSLEELWRVREESIAALQQSAMASRTE